MLTLNIQNGDVVIDNRGQLQELSGTAALKMIVKEALAAKAGLDNIIGTVTVPEQVSSLIMQRITAAMDAIIDAQNGPYRDQRNASERLAVIKTLQVQQLADKQFWFFFLELLSEAGVTAIISGQVQ